MNKNNEQEVAAVPPRPAKTKEFVYGAIFVASVTGVGYFAACAYQIAYLFYFNIPLIFLDVQVNSVLYVGLIGIFWILLNVIIFGWFMADNGAPTSLKRTVVILAGIVQLLVPTLLIVADPINWTRSLALFGIIIMGFILLAQELKRDIGIERESVDKVLEKIRADLGATVLLLVIAVFVFVSFGAGFGLIVAKAKVNFLVPDSSPTTAIISTWGANFVGLAFDPQTGELGKEIRLISRDAAANSFQMKALVPTYLYTRD